MTPAQRSLYGRMGAAIARSRHDPRALTSEARKRFLARFEAQVRAEHPDLPDAEIQRRAAELRKAYMLALAAKSSIARGKKRALTTEKAARADTRAATADAAMVAAVTTTGDTADAAPTRKRRAA